jgi:hypothetical protein
MTMAKLFTLDEMIAERRNDPEWVKKWSLTPEEKAEMEAKAAHAARIAELKDAVVEAAKAVFVIYGGQREKMKALSNAVKALEQAE